MLPFSVFLFWRVSDAISCFRPAVSLSLHCGCSHRELDGVAAAVRSPVSACCTAVGITYTQTDPVPPRLRRARLSLPSPPLPLSLPSSPTPSPPVPPLPAGWHSLRPSEWLAQHRCRDRGCHPHRALCHQSSLTIESDCVTCCLPPPSPSASILHGSVTSSKDPPCLHIVFPRHNQDSILIFLFDW